MRILITGGTGFIGRHLVAALRQRGEHCVVISRSGKHPGGQGPGSVEVVAADPTRAGTWQAAVAQADAIINLAGERIVDPWRRWTPARKERLIASRVETTRQIAAAIRQAASRPKVLVSGSAIGYYGPRGDAVLDESAPAGGDFLARLAVQWEQAALEAADLVRVVLLRTGLVLARDAPALAPLVPLFRLGLGGSWGDGKGWWSWIHIADLVGLVLWALDYEITGPLNATAPNPVTVDEFADTLGAVFQRPVWFRMPAIGLRLALGEAADALLHLQRVIPAKALAAGYAFQFPTLRQALEDLF
jgi:uncharacterized protein (TIGR01777 family)